MAGHLVLTLGKTLCMFTAQTFWDTELFEYDFTLWPSLYKSYEFFGIFGLFVASGNAFCLKYNSSALYKLLNE